MVFSLSGSHSGGISLGISLSLSPLFSEAESKGFGRCPATRSGTPDVG